MFSFHAFVHHLYNDAKVQIGVKMGTNFWLITERRGLPFTKINDCSLPRDINCNQHYFHDWMKNNHDLPNASNLVPYIVLPFAVLKKHTLSLNSLN